MNKNKNNKDIIKEEIVFFVAQENGKYDAPGLWQTPLVGFADVYHPSIRELRQSAHKQHQMPEEVLADASIVIAYFIPFQERVVESNRESGLASPLWAQSYEETNAMMGRLNEHIIGTVHKLGYEAAIASEAGVFDKESVTSRWSFRHFAYAAGLGTFGINNMLITEKGCAGRCNAIVTNLDVVPDAPKAEEACLAKRMEACGLCREKCFSGALQEEGFDRQKCFAQCLKNAQVYRDFGSSYASAEGQDTEVSGSEVCGKCLTGLPCTYRIP